MTRIKPHPFRSAMPFPERRRSGAMAPAALALGLVLISCAEHSSTGISAPIGADAPERLCDRLGFAPASPGLASCVAKIGGLARAQVESQKQCEGIRQRARNTPFPSGGIGNTIATADADYQSCMNGQLVPPAQLQLPTGRTATCRIEATEIACD